MALKKFFERVRANDLDIGSSDFVSTGDFVGRLSAGPNSKRTVSFTDTSYASDQGLSLFPVQWDQVIPTDAQGAVLSILRVVPGSGESVSIRLRNVEDSENVFEQTGITTTTDIVRVDNYTPQTTGGRIRLRFEWQEDTGSNPSDIFDPKNVVGVQL